MLAYILSYNKIYENVRSSPCIESVEKIASIHLHLAMDSRTYLYVDFVKVVVDIGRFES